LKEGKYAKRVSTREEKARIPVEPEKRYTTGRQLKEGKYAKRVSTREEKARIPVEPEKRYTTGRQLKEGKKQALGRFPQYAKRVSTRSIITVKHTKAERPQKYTSHTYFPKVKKTYYRVQPAGRNLTHNQPRPISTQSYSKPSGITLPKFSSPKISVAPASKPASISLPTFKSEPKKEEKHTGLSLGKKLGL
jgi:hypothetical protein